MTQDEQHLDLLSIFHYILGGVTAFFACFPFIHVGLGIAMLCGAFDGKNPPPRILGLVFVVLGSAFIVCGWTLAGLMIAAGRKLKRRVSYTFCFVVACLECLVMPLGTVLGVFTILVLVKDSVKSLFGAAHTGAHTG